MSTGIGNISWVVLVFICFISCSTDELTNELDNIKNNKQTLIDDMKLPHEGLPHGVPEHFDWQAKPRVGYGNNLPKGWSAIIPWGQVYFDIDQIMVKNTAVYLRHLQVWYLSKSTQKWIQVQLSSNINGAYYVEDFQGDVSQPADIFKENTGVSVQLIKDHNFHFWPEEGRCEIQADDIDGVWVSMQGRLKQVDDKKVDDRSKARLLLSVGADYWLSKNATWDQWKTNGDVGIGRFKYLNAQWQWFNMHTLTDRQLDENPPPFQ
ncbi:hypothetical protein SAMN06265379_11079 [Saccharicrinis carchari]|uniref:Uncharacterized protein n=1 Tax=Saccharicrinis carchari TaxID=1168039 RepID=A0A521EPU2_SACCC|nr:hypothetical protein [Saccharicrinis carchari]SMO85946.1 hypothetical protein SAMN06265379_11079 [Saccharicrinis carchari]